MTEPTQAMVLSQRFDLVPKSLEEAMTFAEIMAKSDLVPKDFQGKPGNILVAVQLGLELGLKPLQALQNIAVINGRPTVWGDSMLAMVKSSPVHEWTTEKVENGIASCTTKRKSDPQPVMRAFSMAQAKQAGLAGKQGAWTQYPDRMLQLRARAFCLRDVYPDVLKGLQMREEVDDYETVAPAQDGQPEIQMPRRKSEAPTAEASPAPTVQVAETLAEFRKQHTPTDTPAESAKPGTFTKKHADLWNAIVDAVGSNNGAAGEKLYALTGKRLIKEVSEAEAVMGLAKLAGQGVQTVQQVFPGTAAA